MFDASHRAKVNDSADPVAAVKAKLKSVLSSEREEDTQTFLHSHRQILLNAFGDQWSTEATERPILEAEHARQPSQRARPR